MNRLASLIVLTACVFALQAAAQEKASPDKTGLAIGEGAPDFTLKDQEGKDIALKTLLKEGAVALVFHRSADW